MYLWMPKFILRKKLKKVIFIYLFPLYSLYSFISIITFIFSLFSRKIKLSKLLQKQEPLKSYWNFKENRFFFTSWFPLLLSEFKFEKFRKYFFMHWVTHFASRYNFAYFFEWLLTRPLNFVVTCLNYKCLQGKEKVLCFLIFL